MLYGGVKVRCVLSQPIKRRMGMKKALLVGLFVVIALLWQGIVWAEEPRIPRGARRIDPIRIDDRVSGATASQSARALIEIPPVPNVFLYSFLMERGAQIGIASAVKFAPLEPVQVQLLINGQNIMSAWSLAQGNGGQLPKGAVVDLKEYRQFVDIQLPFFLQPGEYTVEVRIFPFFNLSLYWAFFFSLRVNSFEFWAEQCLDAPDAVLVKYYITAIGAPPKVVSIEVADLTTSVEVVKGVAEWRLQDTLYYERLAGKALETTLTDGHTGVAVTHNIFYADKLFGCGSLGFVNVK